MRWPIGIASLVIAACVTINVYFPTAAAEQAADQVIREVTGGAEPARRTPAAPPGGSVRAAGESPILFAAATLLDALIPAAYAQSEANLDISSPEIRAITASMRERFPKLEPYFASGAIGLTNKGLIELRDQSLVPLAERANVRRLIAEENKDRDTLYAEIAKANGHPEWEPNIREIFARRWVESPDGARPGWYYQNAAGAWVQK
ncbi:MAG: YdbL family protein [Gammaproteobacteria bacterium]|nr:YdbL family protein [Gammaproteobacteria bacterium]